MQRPGVGTGGSYGRGSKIYWNKDNSIRDWLPVSANPQRSAFYQPRPQILFILVDGFFMFNHSMIIERPGRRVLRSRQARREIIFVSSLKSQTLKPNDLYLALGNLECTFYKIQHQNYPLICNVFLSLYLFREVIKHFKLYLYYVAVQPSIVKQIKYLW